MALGVVLGAPKIIAVPDEIRRTLGGVRMDVCAFAGVAAKGPCRRPRIESTNCLDLQELDANWDNHDRTLAVKIHSWDQFRNLFGGFESPGRLPYAVANFFEQGGQQAYICRIVHEYTNSSSNQAGVASCELPTLFAGASPLGLSAKNEGNWGNGLRAASGISFTPIEFMSTDSTTDKILLSDTQQLEPGCLLRFVNDDADNPLDNFSQYRYVDKLAKQGSLASESWFWKIDLSADPLPAKATTLQWLKAQISIEDVNSGAVESFSELAYSPVHSRFIGRVLFSESKLVDPQKSGLLSDLSPPDIHPLEQNMLQYTSQHQLSVAPALFFGGQDRYEEIEHEDFFDQSWVAGNERPGDGIHCLTNLSDCSMLVVPDLYVPESFEIIDTNESPTLLSGADFAPCVDVGPEDLEVEQARPVLDGLLLDTRLPTDLAKVIYLQKRVASLAQQLREFIALLDVPPNQTNQQILRWRTQFNNEFCAAYHPWLKVNQFDQNDNIEADPKIINPSAVAAGIIASTELTKGIAFGPANQIAQSVFALQTHVSNGFHDQIHPMGINVFTAQRDGVWLSAARTLSMQSQWRQLSVVRLMVMLRRALYQQMQWVVFEPNNESLWLSIEFKLENFLRQLYVSGVFKGETPQQAFFVKCDEGLNTQRVIDSGRLIAQIGVAPAEPLEFIIVQLSREADGTLKIVSK